MKVRRTPKAENMVVEHSSADYTYTWLCVACSEEGNGFISTAPWVSFMQHACWVEPPTEISYELVEGF